MATFYLRLSNQEKLKNQIKFSTGFYKIKEEDRRSDKTELLNNLNFINNLTETDIDDNDVKISSRTSISNSGNKSQWLDV